MAVPHFSVSILGRGSGRSAVLAAAYRHCARMDYEREARRIDYSAKAGLLHEEIAIPEDAPAWLRSMIADRSVSSASEALWNKVEIFERRSDAQLAKDVTIALPHELSAAQNIALMRDFIATHVVSKGMVADWVYHDAPRNPHVHLMMTLRPLTHQGFGSKKTAQLTTDGRPQRARDGKIIYEAWAGGRDDFNQLRDGWFSMQNRHLALAGIDIRIDGRSFERQGIDLLPTAHVGVGVTAIKRKAQAETMTEPRRFPPLERLEIEEQQRLENARRIEQDPGLVLDLIIKEKSVFDARDVAKILNRYIDDVSRFHSLMTQILQHPQILRLDCERIDFNSGLRLPERLTTLGMIRLEAEMVNLAVGLSGIRSHGVDPGVRARIACRHAKLSDEQTVALDHVLAAGRMTAVVGRAGSGKTTMMKAAREAWQASGYRVIGGALAGKAAEGLEREAGIASRTLSSWELAWANGRDQLTENTIMVLDEAGMVSSRQMAFLIEAVARRGAKLVVIGDPDQLQPIEAGAAFRAITERIGYAELGTIYRQREDWMRRASLNLARGNLAEAIASYSEHGRVMPSALKADAVDRLIADWDHDYQPDRSCLILAHLRRDVRMLNGLARARLVDRGLLGPGDAFRTEGGIRHFARGDQIIFLKNDASLGVKNGMLARVLEAAEGRIMASVVDGQTSQPILVEDRFYNNVDHGYATTIHKAQGASVDRVKLLATLSLDRHLTYVAMTRHREDLGVYLGARAFAKAGGLIERLSRKNPKETTLDYDKGRLYRAALRFADLRGLSIVNAARFLVRRRLEWTLRQKQTLQTLSQRLATIGMRLGLRQLVFMTGMRPVDRQKPLVAAVTHHTKSIAEVVEARLAADGGLSSAWQDVRTRFGHVYADPEAAFRAINLDCVLSDPRKAEAVIAHLAREPQVFGALKGTTRLLAARVDKGMRETALVNAPALARALERYLRALGQRRACYEAEEMTIRSKAAIAIPALSTAARKVLEAARDAIDRKDWPQALELACADSLVKAELDAFINAVTDRFGERSLLPAAAGAVDGEMFRALTVGMDKDLQVQMLSAWNLMRTAMQIDAHERSVRLGNPSKALTQSERRSPSAASALSPGPTRHEPPHKGFVLK